MHGNDQAILAGDYLFARGTQLLESLESPYVTKLIALVLQDFAKGESLQGSKEFSTDISIDEYLTKSFYKTASLLAAACKVRFFPIKKPKHITNPFICCEASAVLMGYPPEEADIMYQFAFYLGLSFQVQDDIQEYMFFCDMPRSTLVTLQALCFLNGRCYKYF